MAVSPRTQGNAVLANVAASATSVTLFAVNGQMASRRVVFNDGTGNLYVALTSAAASITNFTYKVAAGGVLELPSPTYSGVVTGIWDGTPTGFARTTQY